MIPDRIDRLIQYALAVAGQLDFGQRELGPIHLVKYVYVGDFAYSEVHEGDIFTEAPWRFYHFGPWTEEVHARIAPAVEAVEAKHRKFTSARYEGEFSRFLLRDERILQRLESELPSVVTSAVKDTVHEFGADTPGLLHHVYQTKPMLNAAPNESLNFEPPTTSEPNSVIGNAERDDARLSRSDFRRRPVADFGARLRERLHAKRRGRSRRFSATPPPRYDDVFFEGLRALDDLAGGCVDQAEGEVVFSHDIWKSPGRTGSDVS